MCGIAGIVNLESGDPVAEADLRQMLAMIRHRGPDEFGIYLDAQAGLGSARLSIIDLQTGQQPIANEDESLWVVFNGEIFNYLELRPQLELRGHRFRTTSDTEVLLHAYEEWGTESLQKFNGQFAFAIWDGRNRRLLLGRDRLGVRPLFYTVNKGRLIFGSEIKSILASGQVPAEAEPATLSQVFTYWSPLSPNTAFRNILQIPPGHYLVTRAGTVHLASYWQPNFPAAETVERSPGNGAVEDYASQLRDLLVDATQIRLRADVPVGAYLSGGLDSSIIAAIIRNYTSNRLDTFSISFADAAFDESAFQKQMAQFLGTEHQVVHATHADIANVFPKVIWHTEVPILRTAPAPMFLLSKLVRDAGYKVVLTGEGADEFLAGYDIFKEAKIRRFWAVQPDSKWRPSLLRRLYPDIAGLANNSAALLAAFFGKDLTAIDSPAYSHALRWRNGRRNCRFLSPEVLQYSRPGHGLDPELPPGFVRWSPLARAQFLEINIFLSQYLLCSQGDRMGMAHSIEGRFPFLDHRVVEFCNHLPSVLKLRGLTEKYLLKRLGRSLVPGAISRRPKRPYRAPIHRSFFNDATPDYVSELLSAEQLKHTGFFNVQAVQQLVQKIKQANSVSESDDMALAGILSTQLLHQQFFRDFPLSPKLSPTEKVKVCCREPQALR